MAVEQFSTEQIERDRKSDTDTTLRRQANFRNETHPVEARSHFTKLHKQNVVMCGARLKSTDQRFLEAAIVRDSVRCCSAVLYSETQLVGVDRQWSTEQAENTHATSGIPGVRPCPVLYL